MNKIVLASSSPRRREILARFNIEPQIAKPHIEEKLNFDESPEQIAMALSFEKASYVANMFDGDEIIVSADTLVSCQGQILGKPKDEKQGIEMIEFLNNREHEVITGICIIKANSNIKVVDYEKTIVKFRKLTSEKIKSYIQTNEYVDKAGGYGIQGYGGLLVEYIKGCYFNVVGFPISKFDYLLEKHFNISLL